MLVSKILWTSAKRSVPPWLGSKRAGCPFTAAWVCCLHVTTFNKVFLLCLSWAECCCARGFWILASHWTFPLDWWQTIFFVTSVSHVHKSCPGSQGANTLFCHHHFQVKISECWCWVGEHGMDNGERRELIVSDSLENSSSQIKGKTYFG